MYLTPPQIEAIVRGTAGRPATSGAELRGLVWPSLAAAAPAPPPVAVVRGANPPTTNAAEAAREQAAAISRKRALEPVRGLESGSTARSGRSSLPHAKAARRPGEGVSEDSVPSAGMMASNPALGGRRAGSEADDDDDDHRLASPFDEVDPPAAARSPPAVGRRIEGLAAAGVASQTIDWADAWGDCMRSLQDLASGEQAVLPRCDKRLACGHSCVRAVHVADGSIDCVCDRCGDASEVAASERRRWQPLREAIVVRGASTSVGCATSPASQGGPAGRSGQGPPLPGSADVEAGGGGEGSRPPPQSMERSPVGAYCATGLGDSGSPLAGRRAAASVGAERAAELAWSPSGWSD